MSHHGVSWQPTRATTCHIAGNKGKHKVQVIESDQIAISLVVIWRQKLGKFLELLTKIQLNWTGENTMSGKTDIMLCRVINLTFERAKRVLDGSAFVCVWCEFCSTITFKPWIQSLWNLVGRLVIYRSRRSHATAMCLYM